VLPDGIEFIEEGTFEGCSSLGAVAVPGSLKHVEARAFAGTGLVADDIAFPEDCEIAANAF
jgi:hypothetical protein